MCFVGPSTEGKKRWILPSHTKKTLLPSCPTTHREAVALPPPQPTGLSFSGGQGSHPQAPPPQCNFHPSSPAKPNPILQEYFVGHPDLGAATTKFSRSRGLRRVSGPEGEHSGQRVQ